MSRRGKKHHADHHADEAWLLPYSDLMTLLLAVFIVLFAVGKIDSTKLEQMSIAMSNLFVSGGSGIIPDGGEYVPPQIVPTELIRHQTPTPKPSKSPEEIMDDENRSFLENMQAEFETYFYEESLGASISSRIDERGLVISLEDSILFDIGSADIRSDNIKVIMQIGKIINDSEHYIRIEGHTDNVPINTAIYPSNWELSGARAARVVRFLIESGVDPEKLSSTGYADTRPVGNNSTVEGRAQNRRVDIIILNSKYNTLEEQIDTIPEIKD